MINWIKEQWESFEKKKEQEFEEYLKRCEVKDAKPCPFCGEEKIRLYKHGVTMEWFFLMCPKCGARVKDLPNKNSAKEWWNSRVEIPVNSKPLKKDFTDNDLPF